MMWKNIMNMLILILLAACPASLSIPRQTVMNPLEPSDPSAMQVSSEHSAILETPDSFVRYQVGNPNFHGLTTVEVQGNGSVTVQFKRGDQEDYYKGTLSSEAFQEFQKTLQANDPRTLKSSRSTGVPDEASIQFTVKGADNSERVTELWSNEQWNNQALRTLVITFTKVAKQISGGKVQY